MVTNYDHFLEFNVIRGVLLEKYYAQCDKRLYSTKMFFYCSKDHFRIFVKAKLIKPIPPVIPALPNS